MAMAAPLVPPDLTPLKPRLAAVGTERAVPTFQDLVFSGPPRRTTGRGLTAAGSFVIHAVLLAAAIVAPLLTDDILPESDQAVRAFFVSPVEAPPPPPPPPPPAPSARVASSAPVVPRPETQNTFVAPMEIPDQVVPDAALDLGVEGGVPGGVEGGVPGGVVGGIVGGLPDAPPPPPPSRAVRIGGNIHAPKLVQRVAPEYPKLAQDARIGGLVILEALVGEDGRVKTVTVLRGQPLLDEAAIAAVRQWRYKPLLLNGQTQEFLLTVTVSFSITTPQSAPAGQ
jgi:periplasmic protein TonB